MCYSMCRRRHKKQKTNTSVIYVDHVVSTMLLSTKQRKCKPCASEYEKGKQKLKHRNYHCLS